MKKLISDYGYDFQLGSSVSQSFSQMDPAESSGLKQQISDGLLDLADKLDSMVASGDAKLKAKRGEVSSMPRHRQLSFAIQSMDVLPPSGQPLAIFCEFEARGCSIPLHSSHPSLPHGPSPLHPPSTSRGHPSHG